MTELQEVQSQLTEVLGRLQHLEDAVGHSEPSPRWQHLVSRPHRWRRQLSVKGRNTTVGQLVGTIRANRYTPEQRATNWTFRLPLSARLFRITPRIGN